MKSASICDVSLGLQDLAPGGSGVPDLQSPALLLGLLLSSHRAGVPWTPDRCQTPRKWGMERRLIPGPALQGLCLAGPLFQLPLPHRSPPYLSFRSTQWGLYTGTGTTRGFGSLDNMSGIIFIEHFLHAMIYTRVLHMFLLISTILRVFITSNLQIRKKKSRKRRVNVPKAHI